MIFRLYHTNLNGSFCLLMRQEHIKIKQPFNLKLCIAFYTNNNKIMWVIWHFLVENFAWKIHDFVTHLRQKPLARSHRTHTNFIKNEFGISILLSLIYAFMCHWNSCYTITKQNNWMVEKREQAIELKIRNYFIVNGKM